ncbi:FHA domain-containing protein [Okeania sp.]|uniref:FHA domain-containing protein n=1 Tax=Okeania sp. TaxID=3100323 RepID=UPI002B4B835E|nr:FHA domain-containing protein [Okeania sp.]MEB3343005.1 FHA domain-containing protein [Okeania sp.]
MAITCNLCFYNRNTDTNEFCEVCGSEIQTSINSFTAQEQWMKNPGGKTFIQSDEQQLNFNQNINNYPLKTPVNTNIFASQNQIIEDAQKNHISPISSTRTPLSKSIVAKLISKEVGAPIREFIIDSHNAIIGKFDPNIGPVEIDLDGFYGNETVSSTHAEIYFENNQWHIKDMGSTYGIYIKPIGKTRFGYRMNKPTILNSGDEISIGKIRLLFLIT